MAYRPLPFGSFSFSGDRSRRSESRLRSLWAVTGADGDESSNSIKGGSNMTLE